MNTPQQLQSAQPQQVATVGALPFALDWKVVLGIAVALFVAWQIMRPKRNRARRRRLMLERLKYQAATAKIRSEA